MTYALDPLHAITARYPFVKEPTMPIAPEAKKKPAIDPKFPIPAIAMAYGIKQWKLQKICKRLFDKCGNLTEDEHHKLISYIKRNKIYKGNI